MKAYSQIDTEGLYTLGTVIVDYRGYRVTAQSIIPGKSSSKSHVDRIFFFLHDIFFVGILEKEQEQSVVYGSVDFGKTVVPNEKYNEMVRTVVKQFNI